MGDTNHDHDDADTTDDTADTDTDVDATEDDADTSKNTDANDADDDSDDTDGDDADSDAEDGGDDDSKGNSDDKSSSDTADDKDTEDDVDDGEEPELRKPKAGASNAEWAAWRSQEKGKKAAKKSGDDSSKSDDDDDSEDTDGLSSEDAQAIDKRIGKHLEPILKREAEQEVEASIATFVKDNPDFAPFATKVKRFALHPSRANVPVKSLFYEVAGDKLLQIGAKRGKAADVKAKATKTGGSNANTDGKGSKDYANMPLADFGKELEDIKIRGSRA